MQNTIQQIVVREQKEDEEIVEVGEFPSPPSVPSLVYPKLTTYDRTTYYSMNIAPSINISTSDTRIMRSLEMAKEFCAKKGNIPKMKKKDKLNRLVGNNEDMDEDDIYHSSTFWKNMEEYFVPLTEEEINFCSSLRFRELGDDDPILLVPKKGKHYIEMWKEELNDLNSREHEIEEKELNDEDTIDNSQNISARIIDALIEENILPPGYSYSLIKSNEINNNQPTEPISNKNIQPESNDNSSQEDEISQELKLLQQQLKEQNKSNCTTMNDIYPKLIDLRENQLQEQQLLEEYKYIEEDIVKILSLKLKR